MHLPHKSVHTEAYTGTQAHATRCIQSPGYTTFLNLLGMTPSLPLPHIVLLSTVVLIAFLINLPPCFPPPRWSESVDFLLVFKTTLHVSLPPSPPTHPPSPAPPSSSIHHSTAHFTVCFCLFPPSVSFAPLPCSLESPSSNPPPVQPPDMNSFYPLTVFPSSFLLFPFHHSSSGPSVRFPPILPSSLPSSSLVLRLHSC